eukprot:2842810-Pleurochrysis_carterae.AAC.3
MRLCRSSRIERGADRAIGVKTYFGRVVQSQQEREDLLERAYLLDFGLPVLPGDYVEHSVHKVGCVPASKKKGAARRIKEMRLERPRAREGRSGEHALHTGETENDVRARKDLC